MSKVVAVTGERGKSTELAKRISKLGVRAFALPTIETVLKKISLRTRAAVENFDKYDYVLITSANTVHFFMKVVGRRRPQAGAARIVAVGPATAQACHEVSLPIDTTPKQFNAQSMIRSLNIKKGTRILFPRSAVAEAELVRSLRARGARVTVAHLYTTRSIAIRLNTKQPDIVVFLSGSSVKSLVKQAHAMLSAHAIAIGENTARTCREAGFKRVTVAKESSLDSIIETIRSLI